MFFRCYNFLCHDLLQYLRFARTLKYYGYMQFQPCLTDYPNNDTPVSVAAGGKELNFRVHIEVGGIPSIKINKIHSYSSSLPFSVKKLYTLQLHAITWSLYLNMKWNQNYLVSVYTVLVYEEMFSKSKYWHVIRNGIISNILCSCDCAVLYISIRIQHY